MNPYSFMIRGRPNPDSSEYNNVSHGNIHVWVMASDIETAEQIARLFIARYNWIPENTEYAFEIQPEQIPRLHEAEARLYRQALDRGIAADFVAVKKGEPIAPNVVEYRRMKP